MTSVSQEVCKRAPCDDELALQLHVVVDLAVLRDGNPAVVDRERLMAAGNVDDAQTRRAKRHRTRR